MNHKTRVLIVDDDMAMAKYLSSHLSRRNFEVSVVSSDQEALRVFRGFDPVLVLVDTSMNGTSGTEILQRLKQIKPSVSVMVLSANKDPEMIFRASKLGADDYISKPVDPKDLDVRISRVLDNQRLYREVTQLREQVRRQSDFTMLFGTSPPRPPFGGRASRYCSCAQSPEMLGSPEGKRSGLSVLFSGAAALPSCA